MARGSTRDTRTSCLEYFSGCTGKTSSKAPALDWRSSRGSFTSTEGESGRNQSQSMARRFISRWRKRITATERRARRSEHTHESERSRHIAGGGRFRGRGADDANAAEAKSLREYRHCTGWSGGAGLSVLPRRIFREGHQSHSETGVAGPEVTAGKRPRCIEGDQSGSPDVLHTGDRDDVIEPRRRSAGVLPGRGKQLHHETGKFVAI